ncbi:hypothetical protein BBJ28_00022838 [Nothophytophthora sp. Chile5]|nr:hypothetical protein BBJ28_00022838 [Nothophytophthora sp. Chile5]
MTRIQPLLLLLSLLPLLAAAQPAGSRLPPAATDAYTLVDRAAEGSSVVAVVRRNGVLFLLYDETIIGAEFDDPALRRQTAFPGFTIMQCAAYLARRPQRAAQIGLGIGTVPSFLRAMGIPTGRLETLGYVVEISEAVVQQAAAHFQYEWCPQPQEEEEEPTADCPNGRTFVTDGLQFLTQAPSDVGVAAAYDLFIVDVYTGWNPFAFFLREVMAGLRERWLAADGVLVMNFVGFMHGPRAAAPKAIYRTLQSVFRHVKCFREMAAADEPDAANIVFYASDAPFRFNLPTTREYQDPPENTYFSVASSLSLDASYALISLPSNALFVSVGGRQLPQLGGQPFASLRLHLGGIGLTHSRPCLLSFSCWRQIFTELQTDVEVAIHQDLTDEELRFVTATDDEDDDAGPRVLTEADHGQEAFREIHAATQAHMRERVLEQFPPALWAELQTKSATAAPVAA